ncbi:DNA-processing protein DprA [Flavobacterium rhizosphaerae]|uniref:DNA-processing protein DprA n=1 Tax=Flavobacterium rhizosphaerae TaxID=3163298 RepID=A0ABW8YY65_9FLAO
MTDNELLDILALMRVDGIGDIVAKKLISHLGTAGNVLKATKKQLTAIEGVGEILYNKIQASNTYAQAEAEIKFIKSNNITPLYFLEEDYPEKLKHCVDGPVLLFSSGAINLKHKKIISIVGTRQMTAYGADFCRQLLEGLVPLDPVVVSGFAYGVDIHAHIIAMELGLQTIGVVAHGLNQIYPKVHKKYAAKMEENGGFFTEFWSTANPDKENFVRRNRIVAGLAEATVIVESAEKGGSLITANIANDYNRDVFALPGRVTDKYSMGCNNLIKTQKAHLLTSAADLVYMLNWQPEDKKPKPVQKQLFIELEPEEQAVYDYLLKNGKQQMDIIALECTMPIHKLSSLLLTMELKGAIRPLPGKLFEAV